jgi:hypothetical protein
MVAILNNHTMQYYRPPVMTAEPDTEAVSEALCHALFAPELTETEVWEAGAQPLLRRAKAILGLRLAFSGEDDCTLDGHPASLRRVVEQANAVVRRTGGRYLTYPGVRPSPERSLTMRIQQGIF